MLTCIHQVPLSSGFSNYSTISPFAAGSSGKSVFGIAPATGSNTTTERSQTQPSSSAFSSSGFANFAASSASPFSSVGTTSATSSQTPLPTSPQQCAKSPFASATTAEPTGFGALAGARSGTFGNSRPSSFASTGPSAFGGGLVGSAFGGGFGSGFGGGRQLSSFAAPTGNVKLSASKPKAFGASESDDEDNGSDDGGSSAGDGGDEQEEETSSSKFHVQEGELHILYPHMQAKLTSYSRHRRGRGRNHLPKPRQAVRVPA